MSAKTFDMNGLTLVFDSKRLDLLEIRRGSTAWVRGGPMWKLLVVDKPGQRAFLTGEHAGSVRVTQRAGGVRLTWRGVTDPVFKSGPFDVTVDIQPHAEAVGLTRWRINVVNRSSKWTVWQAEFPRLANVQASKRFDDDRFFMPCAWGSQFRGSEMIDFGCDYPRGIHLAMGYMGYSRGKRSLYLGTHDPAQSRKHLAFSAPKSVGAGKTVSSGALTVTQFPEGQSTARCGLKQGYDIVVGVLDGDWYDASRVYALWAREQTWATQPPAAIASQPRAEREVHAWMQLNVPQRSLDEWAQRVERLAKRLPVRLGIHVYRWHETPFDANYPDYLPARKGFKQWVARVQKSGVLVMPYINARLWDINAPSWKTKRAERYAAGISGERLDPETLVPSLEEYGNGQKLAPMCPATPFWRKTIAQVCRQIVCDLGCDGVYLDQVAAEKPELCLNKAHGHPLGAGGWWLDGYRQMMREIRKAVGPEPYLTTESNWEGCAADYDALLIYHGAWVPKELPMFPVVYGGLARAYGPGFGANDITQDGGQSFARKMGEYFAFGGQPGWGDLTVLTDRGSATVLDFFIRLCRLRAELVDLFATGRMLRPPKVTGDVICTLWQNESGDERTVILVNPTQKRVTTAVKAEGARMFRQVIEPFGLCAIQR